MPHCSRPVARSAALALGAALAGALPLAPAAADVSISPTTAVQGDAASVTFHVRNTRPGAHTVKVEVDLPPDAPVAEVYPMTVPDWAPRIVYRAAGAPLTGLHGSQVTDATSAIVWERSADAPAPPAEETLRMELGPLPRTDRLVLTVVQTYSDGTVQRWQGRSTGAGSGAGSGDGTVLTLVAPQTQAQAGGHAHGGGQSVPAPATTVGSVVPAAPVPPAAQPAGLTLLDVGVGSGLAVGVVLVVVLATRGSGREGRRGGSAGRSPAAVPTAPAVPTDLAPEGTDRGAAQPAGSR